MEIFAGFQAAKGQVEDCSVALGNFDGVHRGHQALIAEALRSARARGVRAGVATFEPHPGKILSPELAPPLMTPLPRKLELLQALGADFVVVQPFDAAYASLEAATFLERDLFGALRPRQLVVGEDFTFGRGRGGNVALLRTACAARGVVLSTLAKVALQGVVISSTKVREFVSEGRVGAAALLLGRPFDLQGVVEHGDGRGRQIGFPTANVQSETELRPAHGVYAVRAWFEGGCREGVANLGRRPTFGVLEPTVEVFLFDFDGDLYGSRIAVELIEWLRGEQKFESVEALTRQIAADCVRARELLRNAEPPGPLSPRLFSAAGAERAP